MEYSYEGDELSRDAGQPSVFTRTLIHGLETGEADRDRDGWVGVEELYGYLHDRVRQATPHQTPTWSAHGLKGELHLARNPHPLPPRVEPEPLPFELRQAAESELAWQRRGAVVGLRRLLSGGRPELVLSATEALQRLANDGDPEVSAAATAALAGQLLTHERDMIRTAPEPQEKPAKPTPRKPPPITPPQPDASTEPSRKRLSERQVEWQTLGTQLLIALHTLAIKRPRNKVLSYVVWGIRIIFVLYVVAGLVASLYYP